MSAILAWNGIAQTVFSIVGTLLYPIFTVFFLAIDTVQNMFYGFAGLGGNIKVNGQTVTATGPNAEGLHGGDMENGIIYYMLRSSTVKNIFLSMLILAVFLLIIFTVLAFIKNTYQTKQKKWQEIISSTIKGAISFVFIPVCCLLGVIAGNVLLRALNEATAGTGDVSISRSLFISSAYNANKFRNGEGDVEKLKSLYSNTFHREMVVREDTDEEYANKLDEVYRSANGPDIYLWGQVEEGYQLWSINYLLLAAGGVFLLFALIKISFGMLKRLFMIILLYVISPVICSMYPLDDGSAVSKWRGEFVKQFFSAYSAVVGMNLFFALVPLINSISWGWL